MNELIGKTVTVSTEFARLRGKLEYDGQKFTVKTGDSEITFREKDVEEFGEYNREIYVHLRDRKRYGACRAIGKRVVFSDGYAIIKGTLRESRDGYFIANNTTVLAKFPDRLVRTRLVDGVFHIKPIG